MKTLGKLNINPEKVMKNEELMLLRGGYSDWKCYVTCTGYEEHNFHLATSYSWWEDEFAEMDCISFFEQVYNNCDCLCDNL